jgi:hypothetical protein
MRRLIAGLLVALPLAAGAAELPVFDAHMHYSHDAWDVLPPKEVIAILKKAGVRRALVARMAGRTAARGGRAHRIQERRGDQMKTVTLFSEAICSCTSQK